MKEIHILLVEDNEGDIVLTLEALKEGKIRNKVTIARDGAEAIDLLLSRKNGQQDEPMPDLILLDINLPKMDGKEVLSIIKKTPDLKNIPVVMLTTSSSEKDILESYSNHANCYITKPVGLEKFMQVLRAIEHFWIHIVSLPVIK
ncbi:MAG: response regulator receiver protein [Bacteroidetes bacterium]|nr:MAG: response regulator receiver protein [Bacteroidota bacterium]